MAPLSQQAAAAASPHSWVGAAALADLNLRKSESVAKDRETFVFDSTYMSVPITMFFFSSNSDVTKNWSNSSTFEYIWTYSEECYFSGLLCYFFANGAVFFLYFAVKIDIHI